MNNIGKTISPFYAKTTSGDIYFPKERNGNWTVLYSYVGDFTPDAALDILALDKKLPKFSSYNTNVYGISPDSVDTHIAFLLQLRNQKKDGTIIGFDLISDRNLEISKAYGINNADTDNTINEKAVMIIDPEGVLRSFHKYSNGTGINITEIERELLALQTSAYQFAHTPANWTPGDNVVAYPPTTIKEAQSAISDREKDGLICVDWYICYKEDTGKRSQNSD